MFQSELLLTDISTSSTHYVILQPSKIYNLYSISNLVIDQVDNLFVTDDLDQQDIKNYWNMRKKLHPHWFDGKIVYSSYQESTSTIKISLLKFREYIYLFDHHLISPDEGMFGFKVFLIDTNGKLLIGQRSDKVMSLPGYWTTVGGLFDHTRLDFVTETILREITEETGVDLSHLPIRYHNLTYVDNKGIHLIASIRLDKNIESYGFQPNEEWQGRFEYHNTAEILGMDHRNFTSEFSLLANPLLFENQ